MTIFISSLRGASKASDEANSKEKTMRLLRPAKAGLVMTVQT
ncbi:hypothetical protein MROS_0517 [Melioribacter roseus P3M-2]|uniref:Uncharacterized protein n=1 Tax=Melioribacter roseus (strain DSM 23840 / JCM 17771 / VKM B-2668 / P3M-2) TaxID=1191523 RepID=I6Z3N6_MELRP|nr:hypothetical protein [Melioribacter roseus]AFN73760.1 hypothetical protein MROS_0517 [Melioribacter roseus P3M-2]